MVLEAQASGLPIIVTDSGGPQENVLPEKTGRIVRAGDSEALFQAFEFLLADRVRLKEMGKAARNYVENRSCERAFDQTWQIYRRAEIGGRSSEDKRRKSVGEILKEEEFSRKGNPFDMLMKQKEVLISQ